MRKIKIDTIENIVINYKICKKLFETEKSEISLKAWTLLYEILKEENIDLINETIIYNEYGKPYILSQKIYFNISHSKSLIAIIISDKECGIDIQYVDYDKDYTKYINRLLTKKEIEVYNSKNDKIYYLYKQWTQKEAYYKYIGTGIKISKLSCDINKDNIITEEITKSGEKYLLSYL